MSRKKLIYIIDEKSGDIKQEMEDSQNQYVSLSYLSNQYVEFNRFPVHSQTRIKYEFDNIQVNTELLRPLVNGDVLNRQVFYDTDGTEIKSAVKRLYESYKSLKDEFNRLLDIFRDRLGYESVNIAIVIPYYDEGKEKEVVYPSVSLVMKDDVFEVFSVKTEDVNELPKEIRYYPISKWHSDPIVSNRNEIVEHDGIKYIRTEIPSQLKPFGMVSIYIPNRKSGKDTFIVNYKLAHLGIDDKQPKLFISFELDKNGNIKNSGVRYFEKVSPIEAFATFRYLLGLADEQRRESEINKAITHVRERYNEVKERFMIDTQISKLLDTIYTPLINTDPDTLFEHALNTVGQLISVDFLDDICK